MNHEQLAKEYKAFFVESEAGRNYIAELERLINDAHKDAEDTPELARDYVQRAKGTRDALNHIIAVGTEIKKGRPMK